MAEELFDELLSPSEENNPVIVERRPQTLSPPIQVDEAVTGESFGQQLSIPGSKSIENMENITLETCSMEESIDLGNQSIVTDEPNEPIKLTPEDGPETEDKSGYAGGDPGTTNKGDVPRPKGDAEASEMSSQMEKQNKRDETIAEPQIEPVGDITKYFIESPADKVDDIFGNLAATSVEQLSLKETVDQMDEKSQEIIEADKAKDIRKVRIHLESHSSISEEATTVDFEEDKGIQPLKPTPSTRSLTKFFNNDGTEVESDAKSFFDNFTVGETNDALNVSCSPRPSSSGYPSLEHSGAIPTESGAMVPPVTPPIPSGSPIPSPFHQMSNPPSVTEAAQFFSEPSDSQCSRTSSTSQPHQDTILGTASFSAKDIDDPFTVGLNLSDIDRRYDAWIPSEATRQVLISIMTSVPGSFVPQQDHLTMPGLMNDDPQGDPVRDLVHRFISEQEALKRVCLTADSVQQDETGLRQLINAGCWRSAVDLSGRLLTQCGQGLNKVNTQTKHTPYTLQLWFCRLSLLVRLHLYTVVDLECQAFGNMDKPDMFYEFYQDKYPGRRGSMIPFGLRILHAELPQHLGKTQESLDRLYYIYAIVRKILANLESGLAEDGSMLTLSEDSRKASRSLWESREIHLLYSVANCLLSIKDYAAVLHVLEDLMKKDKHNKGKLLCGIARIYLQMGDMVTAQKYISMAENLTPNSPNSCQSYMNKGFLSLGQNHFVEAYQNFQNAMNADPANAVAVNNMAVCALYTGQLTNALETLETLVHNDPDVYLQEGILFNLCTLYELESSHAIYRKQKLLAMVSKHKGNGFNVACLKMV